MKHHIVTDMRHHVFIFNCKVNSFSTGITIRIIHISIFSDSGESFSRIFDNLPSEFPGATYSEESEIQVKVEDYYRKGIKGHSYDSITYDINESEIVNDGRIVKVEREVINCFNSNQSGRARFIQISRYDGEIVHVLDNCSDLK